MNVRLTSEPSHSPIRLWIPSEADDSFSQLRDVRRGWVVAMEHASLVHFVLWEQIMLGPSFSCPRLCQRQFNSDPSESDADIFHNKHLHEERHRWLQQT